MKKISKTKFLEAYEKGLVTEVFATVVNTKEVVVGKSVEGNAHIPEGYEVVYAEV